MLATGLAAESSAEGGSPMSPTPSAGNPFTRTMSEVAATYARAQAQPESPAAAAAAAAWQAFDRSSGPESHKLPEGGSDAESWHSAMEEDTREDDAGGTRDISSEVTRGCWMLCRQWLRTTHPDTGVSCWLGCARTLCRNSAVQLCRAGQGVSSMWQRSCVQRRLSSS